ARERGPVSIEIDLIPELNLEETGAAVIEYAKTHPSRLVATYLDDILPERLLDEFLVEAGLAATSKFSTFRKEQRNRLVSLLKAFPLGSVKEVILDKGEVVAGGVSLDEVDPQTMRSRVCNGLYLCGEVLDIAGPVGGYNLQAAFATGFVAGDTAHVDSLSSG
ncbi:MAG: NAD(P)/FAD-dependent oxidoreductase, partial [Fimbriimonadales bacterium]